MKTNIIKSLALASVIGLAAIGSAQAAVVIVTRPAPAPVVVKTCYINGHYVSCSTRYYHGKPYYYYHGGYYKCNPSGCFRCAPGMLCS
jgi:hypothetical protein